MRQISYTAYGIDFVRSTKLSELQISIGLESLCDTVHNVSIGKVQKKPTKKLLKLPSLEDDIWTHLKSQRVLQNILSAE